MTALSGARLEARAPDRLMQLAGRSAYASGAFSAIGITFLVAMFVVHGPFGRLNDVCVILQYLLALPIPLALHQLLGARAPALSRAGTLIGLAGIIAIIVLQIFLVAGLMSFEQEVGWVMFAMFVLFGAWLAITAYLARATGYLPRSVLMSALAWTYVGYPVWAFWIGRRLLSGGAVEQRT